MRILSVGNSFSVDAQYWLNDIASAGGAEMEIWNLYIGGCSLERHMQNVLSGECAYDLYINNALSGKSSIDAALSAGKWDYITLQQASGYSGLWESYENTLLPLYEHVRKFQPDAEIVIQETWAYEKTSTHPHFEYYNGDQEKMHAMLKSCYERAAEQIKAKMIPVGNAVMAARENPLFDIEKGGEALSRDGFHLSMVAGRYLAAAVWYEFFTGKDVRENGFTPGWKKLSGFEDGKGIFEDMEESKPCEEKMRVLKEIAHAIVNG